MIKTPIGMNEHLCEYLAPPSGTNSSLQPHHSNWDHYVFFVLVFVTCSFQPDVTSLIIQNLIPSLTNLTCGGAL